jgi:hypothetical protein
MLINGGEGEHDVEGWVEDDKLDERDFVACSILGWSIVATWLTSFDGRRELVRS